jgi:peptide/nickel transport system substrate-binding protein
MAHVTRIGWLVIAVAVVGAACSAGGSSDDASSSGAAPHPPGRPVHTGGTLTVDVSAETDSFNPYRGTWSQASYVVANAVFEPLATVDSQGIARAYLAESITSDGDFMNWTITARPGVTFQNGQPLDAAALKKNLDAARTTGLVSQGETLIKSIDVISDRAVVVRMSQPWATYPATLAMQSGYMAAPAMLDDPAGVDATPIGTGPFMVQLRQRDGFVKTTRNPNYWRRDASGVQLPYLDNVNFDIVPDVATRSTALSSNEVDAIDVETSDALHAEGQAAQNGRVQLISNAGTESDETVMALNTATPPFDDLLARQALAYAIDQDQLTGPASAGAFPAAWGMFEPDSPYYIPREEAGYPAPDAGRARDLAQQYEQSHGQPLHFSMLLPSDPQYLGLGQALQAQLAGAGITVDVKAVEQTQLIRSVIVSGAYQAAGFVLRSSPTPDQSYVFLATKANPKGLSVNFSRLDEPDLTTAMAAFRAAADPKSRVEAVKTVQKQLAENLPVIFLSHMRAALVAQNGVEGLHGTTYPGTDKETYAPYPNTPFYTFAWKDPSG